MTLACSPTSMRAAVSSVKCGSKLNPILAKNALLRSRSATGMFTNSMRPGCAGVVTADLQVVKRTGTSWWWTPRVGRTHRSRTERRREKRRREDVVATSNDRSAAPFRSRQTPTLHEPAAGHVVPDERGGLGEPWRPRPRKRPAHVREETSVNKSELVSRLTERLGGDRATANAAVNGVLEEIEGSVARGE